jgi:hypothetical protein
MRPEERLARGLLATKDFDLREDLAEVLGVSATDLIAKTVATMGTERPKK